PTALHDGEKNLQYTADVYNDSTRCASLLFAGASGSYLIWKRLDVRPITLAPLRLANASILDAFAIMVGNRPLSIQPRLSIRRPFGPTRALADG
ncbi:MAG: hypothetical protein AB7E10_09435, partial [Burkholderiaceae bacterium]